MAENLFHVLEVFSAIHKYAPASGNLLVTSFQLEVQTSSINIISALNHQRHA